MSTLFAFVSLRVLVVKDLSILSALNSGSPQ